MCRKSWSVFFFTLLHQQTGKGQNRLSDRRFSLPNIIPHSNAILFHPFGIQLCFQALYRHEPNAKSALSSKLKLDPF